MSKITTITCFVGPADDSPRHQRNLDSLRRLLPGLRDAATRTLYLVASDAPLHDGTLARLLDLLGSPQRYRHEPGAILVLPRSGTISPWSSKATDIAHSCGLEEVVRIEHGRMWRFETDTTATTVPEPVLQALHDRMTQQATTDETAIEALFSVATPRPLERIALGSDAASALAAANLRLGLALADDELAYLADNYRALGRDPSDVELMMFAQANSEHCRHKIFNAAWTVDGQAADRSLFQMIRHTHEVNPGGVLSAYQDNAAVTRGYPGRRFFAEHDAREYRYHAEDVHLLMKVETHNHPTAISPYPGAATGSGGEIRDEAATGRGAKSKAGLTGFSVSHLRIPELRQPWEDDFGSPARIATPLEIMLEAPIGAAAFNNEFGRPALAGYFRTFEQAGADPGVRWGYHKPIMLAGGMGNVRAVHVEKDIIAPGSAIVVLGGPAMLIGLGGGAASSVASGDSDASLDFASVQRDNAEMQRRCQEVIDACWSLGPGNPIVSIHDVGAGGLSNAVPEIIHGSRRGGAFQLRAVPNADPGMSPLEIWCNEAQERYVLAVAPENLARFEAICARERCPVAVIGHATQADRLIVEDEHADDRPIDIPLPVLLGKPPRMRRQADRDSSEHAPADFSGIELGEAARRVLHLPAVADKRFLITIGDRTVSGAVARDQMVGPWQEPVADCAVTATSFGDITGEAMAVGERTPLAVLDAPAAGRMAVGEALTNLAAARIKRIEDVCLSANWMAACGYGHEDARLFDTVRAVGLELCPQLGIAIPVGKDSLSMKTVWQEGGAERTVAAPLSLIVSAFAPVMDVEQSLTPQLREEDSELWLIDLGRGRRRLGGSALAQVFGIAGGAPPDLDDARALRDFFRIIQLLNEQAYLLAYHDRADGGLFTTVMEMALAGRLGVTLELPADADPLAELFCEELGAVIQVPAGSAELLAEVFAGTALAGHVHRIGRPNGARRLVVSAAGEALFDSSLADLHRDWSATTFQMQRLRDDPACAEEEYQDLCRDGDPGLHIDLPEEPARFLAAPHPGGARPRIAILREQGVNGHVEMAAAFDRAGFEAVDVHMTDLLEARVALTDFKGLAACGGFSYGDVLGAGSGWARSILYNARLRDQFAAFFARNDSFALGVCNGCQMLAQLKTLIPGAANWPRFVRNRSDQFEARLVMTEILESPSVLLAGMQGARLPTVVAHGEGRAAFDNEAARGDACIALRFVDNCGEVSERYPANPNGSPDGITGLTTDDGRVTIMMPHPERTFLASQYSWRPPDWPLAEGPWLRLFLNARTWLG